MFSELCNIHSKTNSMQMIKKNKIFLSNIPNYENHKIKITIPQVGLVLELDGIQVVPLLVTLVLVSVRVKEISAPQLPHA